MADITIVGLGPGPAELRTVAVQRALDSAERIFVRGHEEVDLSDLISQPHVTDLTVFHDRSVENRWLPAATEVITSAQQHPVVLAIPGHPRFGEGLVTTTLKLAYEKGLSTRVLDGISATDMLASALGVDPIHQRIQLMAGWTFIDIDAQTPFAGGLLGLSPRLPILITHVYSTEFLTAIHAQLSRILPDDHPVDLISAAGHPDEQRNRTTVGKLTTVTGGPMLALYVPPMEELNATRTATTLQYIVARLRREDGCPWDRKQTNQTLAPSLIDEVYEVIDAINAEDDANLAEELGDLLLLIMMHAQIAEERGAFRLEDVYHDIITKIVRRHPHVFGDDAAQNADDVVGLWQKIKAEEKAERSDKPEKAADGQPHSMPALERATRVLKKYPAEVEPSTSDSRQQALFEAVASVIAAGDDPNDVLKQALESHISGVNEDPVRGEKNASR